MPLTSARRAASTTGGTGASMEVESIGSWPPITACSSAASSTVRDTGPTWSRLLAERDDAVAGHAAVRRLGPDRAGDGGRLADRPAGVGADGERRLERRDGGGGATARPAGDPARGPRGCARGRTRSARWRSPWRTRPCWSCPGSACRPRAGGSRSWRRTAGSSAPGSGSRRWWARHEVATMSLTAIGTPARTCSSSPAARRASTSRAAASAPSVSTCRNAWTSPSTAPIRSRCAWVTSTALISLRDNALAIEAALSRVMSGLTDAPLFEEEGRGRRRGPLSPRPGSGARRSAAARRPARPRGRPRRRGSGAPRPGG